MNERMASRKTDVRQIAEPRNHVSPPHRVQDEQLASSSPIAGLWKAQRWILQPVKKHLRFLPVCLSPSITVSNLNPGGRNAASGSRNRPP